MKVESWTRVEEGEKLQHTDTKLVLPGVCCYLLPSFCFFIIFFFGEKEVRKLFKCFLPPVRKNKSYIQIKQTKSVMESY